MKETHTNERNTMHKAATIGGILAFTYGVALVMAVLIAMYIGTGAPAGTPAHDIIAALS